MMRQTRMAALLCGAVLMLSVQPCETFGGITPVGARAAARARWQGTCARGLEMRTREDERDMPWAWACARACACEKCACAK